MSDGERNRREVLGDEHVDRAKERTTPLTEDFQDLITRYAWGEVWERPGLDRRMRSAITITALVAGGHHEELGLHLRAALRNGLTEERWPRSCCTARSTAACRRPTRPSRWPSGSSARRRSR